MVICGSKPHGAVRSEVNAVVVRVLVIAPGLDECSVGFEKTEMRRPPDKHHNGAFAVGCDRRCFTVPRSAGRQLRPVCRIDLVSIEQARLRVSTRDNSAGNEQDKDQIFHRKPHMKLVLKWLPKHCCKLCGQVPARQYETLSNHVANDSSDGGAQRSDHDCSL